MRAGCLLGAHLLSVAIRSCAAETQKILIAKDPIA
jgi:hypothetical protein